MLKLSQIGPKLDQNWDKIGLVFFILHSRFHIFDLRVLLSTQQSVTFSKNQYTYEYNNSQAIFLNLLNETSS